MAYLAKTGITEAAVQILVMNVSHLMLFLLRLFYELKPVGYGEKTSYWQWDFQLETNDSFLLQATCRWFYFIQFRALHCAR